MHHDIQCPQMRQGITLNRAARDARVPHPHRRHGDHLFHERKIPQVAGDHRQRRDVSPCLPIRRRIEPVALATAIPVTARPPDACHLPVLALRLDSREIPEEIAMSEILPRPPVAHLVFARILFVKLAVAAVASIKRSLDRALPRRRARGDSGESIAARAARLGRNSAAGVGAPGFGWRGEAGMGESAGARGRGRSRAAAIVAEALPG